MLGLWREPLASPDIITDGTVPGRGHYIASPCLHTSGKK